MNSFILLVLVVASVGAGCAAPRSDVGMRPSGQQNAVRDSVELDMSGRGISSFPMEVFSRTELVALDMSRNRLTGAPPSQIGKLKNLISLDLSDNQLTGLSAEIGQLEKLEVLDVSHNALTGLPMELGNLSSLRILNISGNQYSVRDLNAIAAKLPNATIVR